MHRWLTKQQQRHLLRDKCITVEVEHAANPKIFGHPQAFAIAVNNLVRNAFEHTLAGHGPITILIKEHELLVRNQVPDKEQTEPTDGSPQGYGLGLGIVQRLCERNGWTFILHANESQVATRLSWANLEDHP